MTDTFETALSARAAAMADACTRCGKCVEVSPKWDVYVGPMYSEFNSGLANAFSERNNIACTSGLRFRY